MGLRVLDLGPAEILIGIGAFVLGGLVKGVIGMALPVVALSVLTSVISVPDAVALQVLPILTANLWQGAHPTHIGPTLKRFWPLLLTVIAGLVVGTGLLVKIEPRPLYGILGALIALLALAQLVAPDFSVSPAQERWANPVVGFVAGLLGGLATMFGPVLGTYLAALRLPRDSFINSQGVAYFSAGVPLTLLLLARGVLDLRLLWLSAAACIPVFAGLLAGQRLRSRIDPGRFRKIVLGALLLIGANLVRRAVW